MADLVDGGVDEGIDRKKSDKASGIFCDLCSREFVFKTRPGGDLGRFQMQGRQAIEISAGEDYSLGNVSLIEGGDGVGGEDGGRFVGFQALTDERAQLGRGQVHVMIGPPGGGVGRFSLRVCDLGDVWGCERYEK